MPRVTMVMRIPNPMPRLFPTGPDGFCISIKGLLNRGGRRFIPRSGVTSKRLEQREAAHRAAFPPAVRDGGRERDAGQLLRRRGALLSCGSGGVGAADDGG